MPNTVNINRPILAAEYEIIKLSNGDLLLDSIYGRHVSIRSNNQVVEKLLGLCDGSHEVAELTSILEGCGFSISHQNVIDLLDKFIRNGILVESYHSQLPDWLPEEEYARFFTLIDWFDKFQTTDRSSLDYYQKIRDSKVGVIGMGGTGSLIAMMLAATGVRNIKIMDGDHVELSNLVRQVFYDENHVDRLKVEVMKERLESFYSGVTVEAIPNYLEDVASAKSFIEGLDFLFLEADAPRILLNRIVNKACTELRVPYIYSFAGQVGPMYIPGVSACFECLENHMRNKIGQEQHDDIVRNLQVQRTRKYPSVVTGITKVSHYQFSDALGYLTGAYVPQTINKILRNNLVGDSLEEVPYDANCPYCGKGRHDF